MSERVAIQDRYPSDLGHCYGCGPKNPQGHRLKSYVEGDVVVARFEPKPYHVSFPGFVYGGLIASLLDCHGMATASAMTVVETGGRVESAEMPPYVTARLEVNYLKPTPIGRPLEIRGRMRERSERKAIIELELVVEGETTVRAEAVAVRLPQSMRMPQTAG